MQASKALGDGRRSRQKTRRALHLTSFADRRKRLDLRPRRAVGSRQMAAVCQRARSGRLPPLRKSLAGAKRTSGAVDVNGCCAGTNVGLRHEAVGAPAGHDHELAGADGTHVELPALPAAMQGARQDSSPPRFYSTRYPSKRRSQLDDICSYSCGQVAALYSGRYSPPTRASLYSGSAPYA